MQGMIPVKDYTSAAEMLAARKALQLKFYPVTRKALPEPRQEQPEQGRREDPWLTRTPEQRCYLIRSKWTENTSLREAALKITYAIDRKVTAGMIQSHIRLYGKRYIPEVKFCAEAGYRKLLGALSKVDHNGLTSAEYVQAMCDAADMPIEAVRSKDRDRAASQIRQVISYLVSKNYPSLTLYKIGQILERDPTTIKTSIKCVARRVKIWGSTDE